MGRQSQSVASCQNRKWGQLMRGYRVSIPLSRGAKGVKPAFPMPAIDCSHRLRRLSWRNQRGFAEMPHSATVRGGHHCTIDTAQISHRVAVWAALRCSFRSATEFRSHNLLKPFIKTNYGPSGQQCIKEKSHNEAP